MARIELSYARVVDTVTPFLGEGTIGRCLVSSEVRLRDDYVIGGTILEGGPVFLCAW